MILGCRMIQLENCQCAHSGSHEAGSRKPKAEAESGRSYGGGGGVGRGSELRRFSFV